MFRNSIIARVLAGDQGYLHIASPDGMAAFSPVASRLLNTVDPLILASAAGVVNPINYALTTVSGTNAITAFQLPSGFRGMFTLRPTGAFTGATGGAYASDGVTDTIPIGLAFTAVVGRPLIMFTDGKLCYPNYV